MDNINIIDIKDIKKKSKKSYKNEYKKFEKRTDSIFRRAFLNIEDKKKDIIIKKLSLLEKKIINKKINNTQIKKEFDIIIDLNKDYFLSLYERFISPINKKKDGISEVIEYSILSNGKRIRAFIILFIFYLNGGQFIQNVEPFLVSIELIHAFSLIHDDLPALDNDELRRGKLSTWKKYGEAEAILAGDAILNLSYSILLDYFFFIFDIDIKDFINNKNSTDLKNNTTLTFDKNDIYAFSYLQALYRRYLCCMQMLNFSTGIFGMIGGEYKDIVYTNKKIQQSKLIEMYNEKTSALISTAMQIGSIMSIVDNQNDIETYTLLGSNLGILYQLCDDYLELTSDEKTLGKSTKSDINNNKNLPFKTEKQLKNEINKYYKNILINIKKLTFLNEDKKTFLIYFIDYITNRKY